MTKLKYKVEHIGYKLRSVTRQKGPYLKRTFLCPWPHNCLFMCPAYFWIAQFFSSIGCFGQTGRFQIFTYLVWVPLNQEIFQVISIEDILVKFMILDFTFSCLLPLLPLSRGWIYHHLPSPNLLLKGEPGHLIARPWKAFLVWGEWQDMTRLQLP